MNTNKTKVKENKHGLKSSTFWFLFDLFLIYFIYHQMPGDNGTIYYFVDYGFIIFLLISASMNVEDMVRAIKVLWNEHN